MPGKPIGFMITDQSISQQSIPLFARALDNVEAVIAVVDAATRIVVFANRAFRQVFGDDCLGRRCQELLPAILAAQHVPRDASPLVSSAQELFVPRSKQWLSMTVDPAQWLDGRDAYLVTGHDVTVKRQYEDSIKHLAYLDYLTGLPNRYRCEIDLRAAIRDAEERGLTHYLVFIDLDDFKVVNDCHGHDHGDGVLISFALYLGDLFTGGHEVFRFGGDEFVVIVKNPGEEGIRRHLDALLERTRSPWQSQGHEFYCGVSIGAIAFGPGPEDPKALLKKADIAMYHAKKSGKNTYMFYTSGLDQASLVRSEMESLLRSALQNGFQGFDVYYQPYSDSRNGDILGAEALVRLRGPGGELLLPRDFITLAEYLGFMIPLGEHVAGRAAELCRDLNASGARDFSMTVNISAKQFRQKDVAARLIGIFRRAGVEPSKMIVGVAEETALEDMDRMLALCGEFKAAGVRLALDDFGSGKSSFLDMRSLPVDVVKISRRYVETVDDPFTWHFVKLVTDLCRFGNKRVCMNGVENKAQFDFCLRLNIDMIQGFYLHRPGTVEKLHSVLRLRRSAE